MKVSYEWLQSYFDAELPTPEEVARVLTFHAFEIDGVERSGNDTVIDVDVLPNRSSDCLSHRGIARELGVLLALPLKDDPFLRNARAVPDSNVLDVNVENPELCSRFSAVVVNNVSVGPSPAWLVKRLSAIGQRSINNIVDATNYVMFDLGQPLHAFDRDKLAEKDGGHVITVRVGKKGETITVLSGEEYEVGETNLLITDGASGAPLGIAGVKGGKKAEIDHETKNIILEAANFNYVSVRKTSQALKIVTDASVRFQNEPSPELTLYALRAAVELLGGEVEGFVDHYPEKVSHEPVSVATEEVNALLGTAISTGDVAGILDRFSFSYQQEEGVFVVTPPFERTDLTIPEDLIEEIGRVYGYEHIDSTPLPEEWERPKINAAFAYMQKVRNFFVAHGFSEVYTRTLRPEGEVELENALAADKPFIRGSLAPGLRESLTLNEHNAPLLGFSEVRLFEIGTVFDKEGEHVSLAAAVRSTKGPARDTALDQVTKAFDTEFEVPQGRWTCADSVCELDLSALVAEFPPPDAYEPLFEHADTMKYRPFSVYPFVLRDLAVWVPESVPADEVRSLITETAGELLVASHQFDEYKKDGRVSYAFRLIFQSHERTLTDEEVNVIMEKENAALSERGYEAR